MRKFLTLLCGGILAFSLFAWTGSPVKAAEPGDDCGCHDLIPLQGAERNKIVAKLISSDAFKAVKKEAKKNGYSWNGANEVEVVIPAEGVTMVGAKFTNNQGNALMFVFTNGVFVGTTPAD
ncbi:hypothetical protein JK635_00475 [Neobacillus sp. YIM B02564]|uniref:PepSY domain-containing protein n=1 Tax=Neobacillus paridis TaxID=2803862 RepID=A0ABS1TI62_9BACI|nr:hypothetical protein [Neobacillus paridis]MBL4950719.1 hypothetical protein [Neobacillus paridis]